MAEKIAYGIVAVGAYALVGMPLGIPLSAYAFYAGIISILLDIEDHGYATHKKSPLTHSLLFAAIWTLAAWAAYLAMGSQVLQLLSLSTLSAFSSHFLIDSMTKEGIFLFPNNASPRTWLTPISQGSTRAWDCWYMFPSSKWREKHGRDESDPFINLGGIAVSIVIIMYVLV